MPSLTITAKDWEALGISPSSGWFEFKLIHKSINDERILTTKPWLVSLNDGIGDTDLPPAEINNGLLIKSSIDGWSSVVVGGYPETELTLSDLLEYVVDPSTLIPSETWMTAWEATLRQVEEAATAPTAEMLDEVLADPTSSASMRLSKTIAATPSYADAAASANARILLNKLVRGVSDAGVLVVTDSTGNEAWEWCQLLAQFLATKFPGFTVKIQFWDETTGTTYSAATTLQIGTGTYTLTFWVAARAGSVPGYFLGSRFTPAIRSISPDLVFVSHGHNMGDPTTTVANNGLTRNTYLALTEAIAEIHPRAGQILVAQNPTTVPGRETWQAIKANVLDEISGLRGYGFIDVHQSFIDYGYWSENLMNVDSIHPNPEGQLLWSKTVQQAFQDARAAVSTRIEPTPLTRSAKNYLVNPMFSSWASTNPDNWTPNASATTSKDVTDFETGLQACKLTGTVTTGGAQLEQALGATLARELRGQWVTLAIRVRKPTSNTDVVRLTLLDSTGSANQVSTDTPGNLAGSALDAYLWIFVSKKIDIAATNVYVRLFARTTGVNIVEASFDRAYLVRGLMPLAGS